MIRGQRFELDLGSDDEDGPKPDAPVVLGAHVADIQERRPSAPTPPAAPTLKSKTGFPEHRKRPVESKFKKRQQKPAASKATEAPEDVTRFAAPDAATRGGEPASWMDEEKRRIDQENRLKLAGMSNAELEQERAEVVSSLSPAMIQRLLARSNIDSGSNESDLSRPPPKTDGSAEKIASKAPPKTVSFVEPTHPDPHPPPAASDPDQASTLDSLAHDSIHFPHAPQPPSLDPSSPSFLSDLHEKYFPSLPAEPDKLEWMQPSLPADNQSYDPSSTALHAKDIRFSFTGTLIPPRSAAEIPVTAGLHHHADAPDAAGYTIAELALLARSTYAAQRCIAFQTLGRVMYRLGKGEFGNAGEADQEGEDGFSELARGLWSEVEREKVVETLLLAAEGKGPDGGRHVSARAYATEAVHLWRKGGGRRW